MSPRTTTPASVLTLAVVSAGMSDASSTRLLADRLAGATLDALPGTEVVVEHVDLRPLAHAIADHLLTGFPGPELRAALDAVTGADALIAATPTFKASYSGLFKSFFDLFDEGSLEDLPVLVAATGGSARHSLVLDTAMRPLFAYLRAPVLPVGVYAAAEDWGGAGEALEARIRRAGTQLARTVGLLRGGSVPAGDGRREVPAFRREQQDDFAGVPDFADLLARAGQ